MKTNFQRGAIPLIAAIVILVLVGGGVVYYTQNQAQVETEPEPVTTEEEVETVTPPAAQTQPNTQVNTQTRVNPTVLPIQILGPKQLYLQMKAEFGAVQTYADMEVYIRKYGSQSQVAKLAEAQNAPASFRESLVGLMKMSIPSAQEITTIQESIDGSTATLNVSSTKPNSVGTVTMVLENGQWKMEKESWTTRRN